SFLLLRVCTHISTFFPYTTLFRSKVLFFLIGLLPKNKKLIMFESYLGKQYSCNPRAIYEYLKEHNLEYKMYWSIDPKFQNNFKGDRKSTRLNSSHVKISYAVFCLK